MRSILVPVCNTPRGYLLLYRHIFCFVKTFVASCRLLTTLSRQLCFMEALVVWWWQLLPRGGMSCFMDKFVDTWRHLFMMMSSNGNIFRVSGHLCGVFTGPRWIPLTRARDAELWCFPMICVWINVWVNNREAGDLVRYRAHYDVIVMCFVEAFVASLRRVLLHGDSWCFVYKFVASYTHLVFHGNTGCFMEASVVSLSYSLLQGDTWRFMETGKTCYRLETFVVSWQYLGTFGFDTKQHHRQLAIKYSAIRHWVKPSYGTAWDVLLCTHRLFLSWETCDPWKANTYGGCVLVDNPSTIFHRAC